MAKNRYGGKNRTSIGKLKIMEAFGQKLSKVEIWALNDAVNRNNWQYINLDAHLKEFEDIPILVAYVGNRVGDGHNFDTKFDPKTGEEYLSFTAPDAERIVGWIPKDADIHITREGDKNWVVVTGYLWSWYAKELVDKLAGQGGGMEVSVETLVTREHREGDVDVEEEYIILGVTILGDGVAPAVAGANIQKLSAFRKSSARNEILKAAAYAGQTKKEKSDGKHEGVKYHMNFNKNRMKELSKEFAGYTCVGVSDDGNKVALLSEGNMPCLYIRCDSDKGTVVPERIQKAASALIFKTEEGEVEARLDSIIDLCTENAEAVSKENEDLKQINKTLSDEVEAMKKRENARRLEAAKEAVKKELAKRNENRTEEMKFDEKICEDLMKRIEANEFTEMEDKDGAWIGDKAVCSAVSALCMDAQTEMDKQAMEKEKENAKRYLGWNKDNSAEDGNSCETLGDDLRASGEDE